MKEPSVNIYCIGHGRDLPVAKFSKNHNSLCKGHLGTMMFCNDCLKEISDKIFKKCNNFLLATIQMCNSFWLPFNYKAYESLYNFDQTTLKDYNKVIQYCTFLRETEVPVEAWDNLTGNNYITNSLAKEINQSDLNLVDLVERLEEKWTRGLNLDDYLFLEERFNIYTNGETLSPAMLTTVKYLCQAELDVKKLKECNSEQKEIDMAEKRVMNYYKILKLDDFKFKESKTDMEKLIEDWAFYQEEKEPLDWVAENLEDINGFRADNDEIMRAVANKVVGTKDYPLLSLEDVKKNDKK